jgi:hypothetical protein
VKYVPIISKPHNFVCESYQIGKLTRAQFKSKSFTSLEKPLQIIHMDLCGPSQKEGIGGEHYFMLFIDDFSILAWVSFLREKYDVFEKFKKVKALAENQTGRKLKVIRLDKRGEFMSRYFKEFHERHRIKTEYTIPGTPQQNGFVEHQNRSVQ